MLGSGEKKPQFSPLRCAPVEMTKEGVIANQAFLCLCFSFCHSRRESASAPLGEYEKQIPFGNDRKKSKDAREGETTSE
jgi:hypothetical protein